MSDLCRLVYTSRRPARGRQRRAARARESSASWTAVRAATTGAAGITGALLLGTAAPSPRSSKGARAAVEATFERIQCDRASRRHRRAAVRVLWPRASSRGGRWRSSGWSERGSAPPWRRPVARRRSLLDLSRASGRATPSVRCRAGPGPGAGGRGSRGRRRRTRASQESSGRRSRLRRRAERGRSPRPATEGTSRPRRVAPAAFPPVQFLAVVEAGDAVLRAALDEERRPHHGAAPGARRRRGSSARPGRARRRRRSGRHRDLWADRSMPSCGRASRARAKFSRP